jgi:hypothetical protein
MPGEGRIGTLIRIVYTDLRGFVENPDLPPCVGNFQRSIREKMRAFHDLT